MASLLSPSTPVDESHVPTDHLDFSYVDSCTDVRELQAIHAILASGREGHYPALQSHTLTRLLSLTPPSQHSMYRGDQEGAPPADEVHAARDDLNAWLAAMEGGGFKSAPASTPTVTAEQCRVAGNEAFKSGDMRAALAHYSDSLSRDSTSTHAAVVYSNRAQVYLNRGDLDRAAEDADAAVRVDPSYLKAYIRRAAVSHARRRFAAALDDLNTALRLEPEGRHVAGIKSAMEAAKRGLESDLNQPARRRVAIVEEEQETVDKSSSRRMVITTSTGGEAAAADGLVEQTVRVVEPAVQVVDLTPFHAFKSAGDAAVQSKSYAQALESYAAAAALPSIPPHLLAAVYSNTALVHTYLKSWREAVAAASNALTQAFKSLGIAVDWRGVVPSVMPLPLTSPSPSDVGLIKIIIKSLYRAAVACKETGDEAGAIQACSVALAMEADNAHVKALLADMQQEGGSVPAAVTVAREEVSVRETAEEAAPAAAAPAPVNVQTVAASVPVVAVEAAVRADVPQPAAAPPPRAPASATAAATGSAARIASPSSATSSSTASPSSSKPRTHADFERMVMSLSRSSADGPARVFEFIQAHMTRVLRDFKRPLEPELFSIILASMHACGGAEQREWLGQAIAGMLGTPSVRTTVAMLTQEERQHMRDLAALAAYTLPTWAA